MLCTIRQLRQGFFQKYFDGSRFQHLLLCQRISEQPLSSKRYMFHLAFMFPEVWNIASRYLKHFTCSVLCPPKDQLCNVGFWQRPLSLSLDNLIADNSSVHCCTKFSQSPLKTKCVNYGKQQMRKIFLLEILLIQALLFHLFIKLLCHPSRQGNSFLQCLLQLHIIGI